MKKSIEVVAAVIVNDNKVFVAQRGYGDYKGGWEFPGGKMEQGETKEQALTRELREELEINVNVGKLIKTINYEYPNFHLTMHCLLTTIESGKINLLEHKDVKWISKREIDSLNWVPADIEVLEDIKSILN